VFSVVRAVSINGLPFYVILDLNMLKLFCLAYDQTHIANPKPFNADPELVFYINGDLHMAPDPDPALDPGFRIRNY